MAVDVDQGAAEVAAGEQKCLAGQREDKGGGVDVAVLVSRSAREPADGEEGGRCQHGDQVHVCQLALWRSGGQVAPVEQTGQQRRRRQEQAGGGRQQCSVGHGRLPQASRAEDEQRGGDGVGADRDAGQRRVRGVAGVTLEPAGQRHLGSPSGQCPPVGGVGSGGGRHASPRRRASAKRSTAPWARLTLASCSRRPCIWSPR